MRTKLTALSALTTLVMVPEAFADGVELGGSLKFDVEYGLGKENAGFTYKDASASIGLSLAIADTTDSGLKFGGSFSVTGKTSVAFQPYRSTSVDGDVAHWVFKVTGKEFTDIKGRAHLVSGGQAVTEDQIVAIKINSEWRSIGGTHTEYDYNVDGDWNNFLDQAKVDICKIAGRASFNTTNNTKQAVVTRGQTARGQTQAALGGFGGTQVIPANGATFPLNTNLYLPAGQLLIPHLDGGTEQYTVQGLGFQDPLNPLLGWVGNGTNSLGNFIVLTNPITPVEVADEAHVFLGPFASVKLASSTTKLVVGAACVVHETNSDTKYHLQPVNSVLEALNAKVFVEGGFGKLTIQTEDYDGKVPDLNDTGIGNQAKIDHSGLVASIDGYVFEGFTLYGAVDLFGPIQSDLNIMAGAQFDLGGLAATIETSRNKTDALFKKWDASLGYDWDGIELLGVLDSNGGFGGLASAEVNGVKLSGEGWYQATTAHTKSGFKGKITAAASINNWDLSASIDEKGKASADAEVTFTGKFATLSFDASYNQADQGGKMGVKLAF